MAPPKTGRLWVMVRDERPWGSAVPPAAFYRYSADRKDIHAQAEVSKVLSAQLAE